MNVAAATVEVEDHVLEALEAGHLVNRGDVRFWRIHHQSARRGEAEAAATRA
jgi:hypothetical protein